MDSEQVRAIHAFLTDGFASPQSPVALTEVRHVTTFRAYYREEEVTIEIQDDPSQHPTSRYSCVVTTRDGRRATGNPASDPETAITIAHWWDLDKPARR